MVIKPSRPLLQVEFETRMGTLKVDKNYSRNVEGQTAIEQVVKMANSPFTRTTDIPLAATMDPLPVNWQNQEDILGQRGQLAMREEKKEEGMETGMKPIRD